MPALNLDAAFVHMNLGDERGNAAYTGIDPYFDDLFLMAAERRYLSVERIVSTEELIKAVPPQALADQPDDGRHRRRGTRRFPLHHQRTGLRPRREVPAALRRGRRHGRHVAEFVQTYLSGGEAEYQAAVRKFAEEASRMSSATRAEVCAVACAELFRDAGEIMVSPMTNMASVGARLARLTFSPDILLTDGEAQLIADTPAIGKTAAAIEGWMPFGRVFETLSWGRRHVVMGANQIDRYGNQNLSAFGPSSTRPDRCSVSAAHPGNAINHATSYWVGNHSKRVFCETVDIVSGVGWDRGRSDNPAFRFLNVYRVVSNLGVFDFGGPEHQMRALSLHPGVERPTRSWRTPRSRCTASTPSRPPGCRPTTN